MEGFSITAANKKAGGDTEGCTITVSKNGLTKDGECVGVNLQKIEDPKWSKDYTYGSWTANFQ